MITFANILVALVALGVTVSLMLCYRTLTGARDWSLTDALSEAVTLTRIDAQGNPVMPPAPAAAAPDAPAPAAQPLTVTTLKASSSRFIALIGTISILMLYIGFGLACLDRFAAGADIPDMSKGSNFFYAGLVLFAPYIVNKFASAFSFFGK